MNFALTLASTVGTFAFLVVGWGSLLVQRLPLAMRDRMVVAPFAAVLALYLGATVCYLLNAPGIGWGLLAAPAATGWWWGRREWRVWAADAECQRLLGAWGGLVVIGILLLGMVRNYSGGDWIGDWAGHYHRAQYFLHPDGDWDWMFSRDPLAGRPPLQNLVTAALLAIGGESFARYQVFTLLLGSLVVFPASLLVGRNARAGGWLLVLLAASPLVAQNLTYPWTKMGTNAWLLLAFAFGWRAWRNPANGRTTATIAAVAMAAAVLCHYSAVVYLVVLAPVFLGQCWRQRARSTAGWALVAATTVLLTWFGWAAIRLGPEALAGSTTTTQHFEAGGGVGGQLSVFGENLLRTFVPHPLLPAPHPDPAPAHFWAAVRDFWFQLYQTNLPFAIGLPALGLGLLRLRHRRPPRLFAGLIVVAALLGIAVHTAPTHWGAAHICLQPLVLLALVAAARQLAARPGGAPRWLWFALAADVALGIALQFGLESTVVPETAIAWQDGAPLRTLYGQALWANSAAKAAFSYQFLGDPLPWPAWLNGLAAIAILAELARRAARPSAALPTGPGSQH